MNQFDVAREFYGMLKPEILARHPNEWACVPSGWNELFQFTPIEEAIWDCIRDSSAVFYPQYPVDKFFADFANPVARVAIECDGQKFHQDKDRDAERDEKFHELGWTVYRIPGRLCLTAINEESLEEAFAMRLVRAIAEQHGLVRGNPRPRDTDELMPDYLRYAREGKLDLLGVSKD